MCAKYITIMDYIKEEILKGSLKCEDKIPSIREVSNKFNCSKATVIHAYSELEKTDIIYSVPQSGYYVSKPSKEPINSNKIINLDSGSPSKTHMPSLETLPSSNEILSIYSNEILNYNHALGFLPLINTLEDFYKKRDINHENHRICITSGCQEALSILCTMPFPNNKSSILVEQPTYNLMLNLLQLTNKNVNCIERTSEGINLNRLEKLFREKEIKFFYTIPSLHNPTGYTYNYEHRAKILELANKYDVYIVEDDYLGDMLPNVKPMISHNDNSRVIYIKSFSKIYMPALRIASVILPENMVHNFERYKVCFSLNSSTINEAILDIHIKNGLYENHVKSINETFNKKIEILKESLASHDLNGIDLFIPSNGYFLFIKLPNNVKANELINNLNLKNIQVKNGDKFYENKYKQNNSIRISLCKVDNKDIEYSIGEILKEINNLQHSSNSRKIDYV